MCFVMIDEAKRRSLLLFSLVASRVGFFASFFESIFWSTFGSKEE